MLPEISKIKGLHPGVLIKREMKILNLKNKDLALRVDEYPQTLSAVLKGKRGMTTKLSIRLGHEFRVDESYFMVLQAYYDVKQASREIMESPTPDVKMFRTALFWDTNIEGIDWHKHKRFVIKRVFERGNKKERDEVISFYGGDETKRVLEGITHSFIPSFELHVKEFLSEH